MTNNLKKTEVKLDLLTDTNMLLMVEWAIRDGIYDATHRYAEAYNKYMEDYDTNKESLCPTYGGKNSL